MGLDMASEWGWEIQGEKLISLMIDSNPAPDLLVKIVHRNCTGDANHTDVVARNTDFST